MAHSSFTLIGSAAAVAAFTALAVTPLGHQATAQTADVPTGASAPTIQLAQASGNGGSGGGSSRGGGAGGGSGGSGGAGAADRAASGKANGMSASENASAMAADRGGTGMAPAEARGGYNRAMERRHDAVQNAYRGLSIADALGTDALTNFNEAQTRAFIEDGWSGFDSDAQAAPGLEPATQERDSADGDADDDDVDADDGDADS